MFMIKDLKMSFGFLCMKTMIAMTFAGLRTSHIAGLNFTP